MAIEEYDGVIINKVTLEKYKELKVAGSLVASQTYVITDLDKYLDYLMLECDENVNLFGLNQLSKTSFSTTNNTEGYFQFNIWNDNTYETWYAGSDVPTGSLELKYTFSLWEDKTYLIRVGLNGDVEDDKLDISMHLETGAYTLKVVLKSNNTNSCEVEYISLIRTFELPSRLNENLMYNIVSNSDIDNCNTGFYEWSCEDTTLKPNANDQYYYILSQVAYDNTGYWGSQIAIGESTRQMYFRTRADDQVWSAWKRILNETDDAASGSGSASRSIVMARLTSNKSYSSGDNTLPLSQFMRVGSDLSVNSSGGIVCGKSGMVRMSGFLHLDFGTATVPYVSIKYNGNVICKYKLSENNEYFCFGEAIGDVTAGSVITMCVQTNQNRVTALSESYGCRMTVEYLD
jgi:hypothetical protein